ncbi:MAG: phosphonate metabolism protein/1,5-bisphosphokinase (PRPP-forming) PhnN [Proteobacteria bacterium]|nr:phosphonate metabolism protein/1,5-bisphosphokinase (PRPP-forming) PhnN [Pseudomonadota bacterium]
MSYERTKRLGAGVLVFVVGPSGAGKDTLIEGARSEHASHPRIRFVRRTITRMADATEGHESVSPEEFNALHRAGRFALVWQAHGLRYGVPSEAVSLVSDGFVVVCNGSRAAIPAAREVFADLRTVLVTAPAEVLMHRLANRRRDSDIGARAARTVSNFTEASCDLVINNAGTPEDGRDTLARYLEEVAAATA